jgi:uncharacterized membrane protein YhhN
MCQKKSDKMVGWPHVVVCIVAAAGGVGLNAYRTWQAEGGLDGAWFVAAALSVSIIGCLLYFLTRYANRKESRDQP